MVDKIICKRLLLSHGRLYGLETQHFWEPSCLPSKYASASMYLRAEDGSYAFFSNRRAGKEGEAKGLTFLPLTIFD